MLKRHLRRAHIHLVENLLNLHHHLAIAEDDDRVRALIGDDLGVADRDSFRSGIDGLGGKFFREILAAAAAAGSVIARGRSAIARS